MIELSSDALGSIDTVVVILSDYSDTGVRWSDTFKKLFTLILKNLPERGGYWIHWICLCLIRRQLPGVMTN